MAKKNKEQKFQLEKGESKIRRTIYKRGHISLAISQFKTTEKKYNNKKLIIQ